jgi:hypothetical protein
VFFPLAIFYHLGNIRPSLYISGTEPGGQV